MSLLWGERNGETVFHDLSPTVKEENRRPEKYSLWFFFEDAKYCLYPWGLYSEILILIYSIFNQWFAVFRYEKKKVFKGN